LISYSIKKILSGESYYILKYKYKLIALCIGLPLIIMLVPFIYDGYGPSGFYVLIG